MVDLTAKNVNSTHKWSTVDFGSRPPTPVMLASIDTFNGPDTAAVRMRNSVDKVEVFVEEETSQDDETDHNEEVIGILELGGGSVSNAAGDRIGEAGIVHADQDSDDQWHSVSLDRSYSNPVVFMQVMSYNGGNPCHSRLRNVESDSFEFCIEEWDYLDGLHTQELLGYLVLETGVHDLPDIGVVEVDTVEADHTWTAVRFQGNVGSDPVLISRCQTYNGHNEVVTRNRKIDANGAQVRLQEERERDGEHTTETIGFLAARRTTATVTTGKVDADERWVDANLTGIPSTDPVVIGSIETYHGEDPVGVRMRNVGPSRTALFLEEAQSGDDETDHRYELVSLFATDTGPIHDGSGSRIGEAGIVNTNQPGPNHWHSVSLNGSYFDPVVFMQVMSYKGEDPCHTRLRNVGSGSFEFRIEEWNYLDGAHTQEEVGYVVLDRGVHDLPGGIPLEVGTVRADDEFIGVGFSADLGCPVFLSHCQTYEGHNEVVTRNIYVDDSGAAVRLQEESARGDGHTHETVGYLATPRLILGNHRSTDKFRPDCNGFMFVNYFEQIPDLPDLPRNLDDRIEDIDVEYGLCGGMVLAARDFFVHDRPVPEESTPPGSGPLFEYLWQRQLDSFDRANGYQHLAKFIDFYDPTTHTRAKSVPELRSLKQALDGGMPAVLGLVYVRAGSGNIWNNHQVLALDYRESGDTTTISVYDPNFPDLNNVTIKIELEEQADINVVPGDKKIDAEQRVGADKHDDVIGLIHMDVPSQQPPAPL